MLLYDALVQSIMKIVEKLDLSLEKVNKDDEVDFEMKMKAAAHLKSSLKMIPRRLYIHDCNKHPSSKQAYGPYLDVLIAFLPGTEWCGLWIYALFWSHKQPDSQPA